MIRKGRYGHQLVAVKQLFTTIRNPHDLKEFANEVQTLSTLRNFPPIIRLYGISQNQGSVYLIMEWCDTNLNEVMSAGSEIWPSLEIIAQKSSAYYLILNIARQICSAMNILHTNGVVHLDLKPANVLLKRSHRTYLNQDDVVIKLCDFGLSRQLDSDPSSGSGALGGTPLYMAPELLKSAQAHSPIPKGGMEHYGGTFARRVKNRSFEQLQKADVYAFSIFLTSMLNRNQTYQDEYKKYGGKDLLTQIQNGLRPHLSDEIPQHLRIIIEKCWQKAPSKRPSFEELEQEFTQLIFNSKNSSARAR